MENEIGAEMKIYREILNTIVSQNRINERLITNLIKILQEGKGDGVVDRTCLENKLRQTPNVGSNPTPSAIKTIKLPETGFLRLKEVLKIIPFSRSAWLLGAKSGRFPKSIKLGKRAVAWRVEDIRDLIERM